MKILLLNPPGLRNYCRDYYLGGELEPGFCMPPQDIVCLSGILAEAGDLLVLDALAEGLSAPQALLRISRYSPDYIFFLVSAPSYAEDAEFLRELKKRCPRAKFIGMGDVYRDIKETAFALHPFLDAILLDFTTEDASRYLRGERGFLENVMWRDGQGIGGGPERHHYGHWSLPVPRWDLFPLNKYSWPMAGQGLSATLLTDFGCPYLCSYCPAKSLAYKSRDVESVLEEAELLKGLGVRHVLFRDQTFGVHRRRTLELLERLSQEKIGLSWSCSTRVDLVDETLLVLMKKAGCVSVSYGIDSGDDEVLRAYKKNTTRRSAMEALQLTHRCGLKTWGTFLIGLSLDTKHSVEATLRFAAELPLDHVSLRVESQRYAVDYRRDMLVRGLVPPEAMPPDTPTSISVWQGRLGLSNQDVMNYYGKGVREFRRGRSGRRS